MVSVKIYLTELKSIGKRHTIFNVVREEVEEGSFLGVRQGFVIGFGTAVVISDLWGRGTNFGDGYSYLYIRRS